LNLLAISGTPRLFWNTCFNSIPLAMKNEAVYQPQERGLSSAARSDNGDEFSGRDFVLTPATRTFPPTLRDRSLVSSLAA
jgi:hypothetical protein